MKNYIHVLLFVALFVASCGDGKIVVTGSINYEGQVPESGTIAFITDNGAGTTYGEPYTEGQYKVRLPEGEYLVRITGKQMILLDTSLPGVFGGPPITHREEQIIPDIYGLRSKLQITVDKSTRTYDFDLKKK